MSFEPTPPTPSVAALRRRSIVAEALLEKLQKLRIGHATLMRERASLEQAMDKMRGELARIESEMTELRDALQGYHVTVPSGNAVVERRAVTYRESIGARAEALHKARLFAEGPTETASASLVVATVKAILETVGEAHVRDLFEMLNHQKIELPSPQRLSQILSESEMFEANRVRGWKLKEEKPGFGRPGFSVSTATPSGDGS